MRRRLAAGLAFVAMVLAVNSARADARTEARAHFKKGMSAISNGRYEDGIAELQRAYDLLPHPNVLYNIGRAYAESGDLEAAVETYRKYLESNPSDRDEVAQIVTSLEGRIKRQQAVAAAARQEFVPNPAPSPAPAPAPSPSAAATPTTPATQAPPVAPVAPMPLGAKKTYDVFEETVVTASRHAQSPIDAPNSTSIITGQDIRLSGITKVPELLRRLAGVEVMEVTGSQTEVSLRGFNQRLSNKILVLVDGRSVFVDLLGATFWQTLSIGVEDIERIEVVRGPGSALYGADAFNGVINIITKRPGEGKSGVNAGFGDHDQMHGSFWATGRDAELAWRASAGYDYIPRWSREVPDGRADLHLFTPDQNTSGRTSRFDLRLSRSLGKDVSVGLGGGMSQGQIEILGIGQLNDIVLSDFTVTDLTGTISSPHLDVRVFWSRIRAREGLNAAPIGQTLVPGRPENDVVDAEVRYKGSFETGKGISHDLHVGVGFRHKAVDWTYLDRPRFEEHEALFLHDEVKLGEYFGVVGDYRLDYVPYLASFVQSPRGTLLVHPSKRSTARATVATAFRTPTFLESYLSLPTQLPAPGGSLVSISQRTDEPGFRLKAENIATAELGYVNQESDLFAFDSAFFFNRVTHLIQLASKRAVTAGDLAAGIVAYDPNTGTYPLFFGGFDNQCQVYNVLGGEMGVRVFPVEGLDVYANYTLNVVRQDDSGCSAAQKALLVKDERTSMHKINGGVQLRTRLGFDGSVDVHFISPQTWGEQVVNFAAQRIEYQAYPLPSYTLLNARLGYRFLHDHADVSAVAFNLLGLEHREHPFGQLLGRRVMGFLTYRF